MEDCIFCKIIKGEIPSEIIWEDEDFIAIVDIQPNNFGHSLVIPKEHYENIYTLAGKARDRLGEAIQKISIAVKKAVEADGINVHMNNERTAGQLVMHQHTHIIPRFENDGLKHFVQKQYESPEQIKEMGSKIRSALS